MVAGSKSSAQNRKTIPEDAQIEYKTPRERELALGTLADPNEGRFYGNIKQFWTTMKQPKSGEWLSCNTEPG